MTSKIIITPKATGIKQKRVLKDLNSYLKNRGIRTEIQSQSHGKGKLGGGIFGGIATVLTGGDGFFSKIGEALVQYVVNKKTELSIKNEMGQEIALTSSMTHDQILLIINNFFNQNIAETEAVKKKKKIIDKKPIVRAAKKTTTTRVKKRASTKNNITKTKQKSDEMNDRAKKMEAIRKLKLNKKVKK